MRCLERLEYFFARVPVTIVEAARDDGEARRHASKEVRLGGRGAAVMADLEDAALERQLREHCSFNGRFRIAFEQH